MEEISTLLQGLGEALVAAASEVKEGGLQLSLCDDSHESGTLVLSNAMRIRAVLRSTGAAQLPPDCHAVVCSALVGHAATLAYTDGAGPALDTLCQSIVELIAQLGTSGLSCIESTLRALLEAIIALPRPFTNAAATYASDPLLALWSRVLACAGALSVAEVDALALSLLQALFESLHSADPVLFPLSRPSASTAPLAFIRASSGLVPFCLLRPQLLEALRSLCVLHRAKHPANLPSAHASASAMSLVVARQVGLFAKPLLRALAREWRDSMGASTWAFAAPHRRLPFAVLAAARASAASSGRGMTRALSGSALLEPLLGLAGALGVLPLRLTVLPVLWSDFVPALEWAAEGGAAGAAAAGANGSAGSARAKGIPSNLLAFTFALTAQVLYDCIPKATPAPAPAPAPSPAPALAATVAAVPLPGKISLGASSSPFAVGAAPAGAAMTDATATHCPSPALPDASEDSPLSPLEDLRAETPVPGSRRSLRASEAAAEAAAAAATAAAVAEVGLLPGAVPGPTTAALIAADESAEAAAAADFEFSVNAVAVPGPSSRKASSPAAGALGAGGRGRVRARAGASGPGSGDEEGLSDSADDDGYGAESLHVGGTDISDADAETDLTASSSSSESEEDGEDAEVGDNGDVEDFRVRDFAALLSRGSTTLTSPFDRSTPLMSLVSPGLSLNEAATPPTLHTLRAAALRSPAAIALRFLALQAGRSASAAAAGAGVVPAGTAGPRLKRQRTMSMSNVFEVPPSSSSAGGDGDVDLAAAAGSADAVSSPAPPSPSLRISTQAPAAPSLPSPSLDPSPTTRALTPSPPSSSSHHQHHHHGPSSADALLAVLRAIVWTHAGRIGELWPVVVDVLLGEGGRDAAQDGRV